MNSLRLLAFSLACIALTGICYAVKMDLPGQAERESSNIVTGTVLTIYSKHTRDAYYEWNRCVAAFRIESVEKGDGLKTGDLIYVRYLADMKWIGRNGFPPPGPSGHNNIPNEGDRRKVCFTKAADGGYDVYYVSGFKSPDENKLAGLPGATTPARAEVAAPAEKRLLIVAPQAFRETLAAYVDFKKRFRPTELVDLEDILAATPGADDPERLKRYFFTTWQKDKTLGYVLLVGDRDVLPVRYMVLDRATPAAFDYAFYPSDLYYADLARADGSFDDWNGQKEDFHAGYFGEVRGEKNKGDPINFDGVSYQPKLAVGRWPASTAEEVQTIAAKSIACETGVREGTHPGLRKACLFHPGGWVDMRSRASRFTVVGWAMTDFFFQDANPAFQTPPPDPANLQAALNAGCELCIHIGHGSETSWEGSPNPPGGGGRQSVLSTESLKLLANADRLPVIISAGCSTAHFSPLGPYERYVDTAGIEHKGTDHGEVFTAPPPPPAALQKIHIQAGLGRRLLTDGPNGAVAYIGCNTGSQPCGVTLVEGFMAALNEAAQPRLGDCWSSAIDYYRTHEHLETLQPKANDWYPPSIFFQGMKFMLFGDPSLPMASPRSAETNH